VPFDETFWVRVNQKVEENIENNVIIPDHVRP
jgi:hypothetical protein